MKLTVVISVLNQFPIARQTLKYLSQTEDRPYDILVIDNGSDEEFKTDISGTKVVRLEEAVGSYPIYNVALNHTDSDVLAFFHSDFFVYDPDWHNKVIAEFAKDPVLGMIGFIGSNEIDSAGGRGMGTAGNFVGRTTTDGQNTWSSSPMYHHGKVITGFMNAAVVDGCSMILRRRALEDIGFRDKFPIHHFYDKLISTQLLEKNWKIGILGIECDHISGQTVSKEQKYLDACKKWATENHISPGGLGVNWDNVIYTESERQWLAEYRDQKHIIPIKV